MKKKFIGVFLLGLLFLVSSAPVPEKCEPLADSSFRTGMLALINAAIADLQTVGEEDLVISVLGLATVTGRGGLNCHSIQVEGDVTDISVDDANLLRFSLIGFTVICENTETEIEGDEGILLVDVSSSNLDFVGAVNTTAYPHELILDCAVQPDTTEFTLELKGFDQSFPELLAGLANSGIANGILVAEVEKALCDEVGGKLREFAEGPIGNISTLLEEARVNATFFEALEDENRITSVNGPDFVEGLLNYAEEDEIELVHNIVNAFGAARTAQGELGLNRLIKALLFPEDDGWRPFDEIPEDFANLVELDVNEELKLKAGISDLLVNGLNSLSGLTVDVKDPGILTWEIATGLEFSEALVRVPAIVNSKRPLQPLCNVLDEELVVGLKITDLQVSVPICLPIVQDDMNALPISGLAQTNISCLATAFLEPAKVNPYLEIGEALLSITNIQDELLNDIVQGLVKLFNNVYSPIVLEALPGLVMGYKGDLDALIEEAVFEEAECNLALEPESPLEAISHLTLGYVLEPERSELKDFLRYEDTLERLEDVFGLASNGYVQSALEIVENLDAEDFAFDPELNCTALDVLGNLTEGGLDPPLPPELGTAPTAAPTTVAEREKAGIEFELNYLEIGPNFNLSDIFGHFTLQGHGEATVMLNYTAPKPVELAISAALSLYNTTLKDIGEELVYSDTLAINATMEDVNVLISAMLPFSNPRVDNATVGALLTRPLRCATSLLSQPAMVTPAVHLSNFESPNGGTFLERAIKFATQYLFMLPEWWVSEALTDAVTDQLIREIVDLVLDYLGVQSEQQINDLLDSFMSGLDIALNLVVASYWLSAFCPIPKVYPPENSGFSFYEDPIFSGIHSILDTCILPKVNEGFVTGLTTDQSGIPGTLIFTDLFDPIEIEIPEDGIDFADDSNEGYGRRLAAGNSSDVPTFYLELVNLKIENINTLENVDLLESTKENPFTLHNALEIGYPTSRFAISARLRFGMDAELNDVTIGLSVDKLEFLLDILLKFDKNRINAHELTKILKLDCWLGDLDEASLRALFLHLDSMKVDFTCNDCSNNQVLQEFVTRTNDPVATAEINDIFNTWFDEIAQTALSEDGLGDMTDDILEFREACERDGPADYEMDDHGLAPGGLELLSMIAAGLSVAGATSCCIRTYKGHRYKKGQALLDLGLVDEDDPWAASKRRKQMARMESSATDSTRSNNSNGNRNPVPRLDRKLLVAGLKEFLATNDGGKQWSNEAVHRLADTVKVSATGTIRGYRDLNKKLHEWTGAHLGSIQKFLVDTQGIAAAQVVDAHKLRHELSVFLEENDRQRTWDEFAIEELVSWVIGTGDSQPKDPETGFNRLNSQLEKLYGRGMGSFQRFRNSDGEVQNVQSNRFGAFGDNLDGGLWDDESEVMPTVGRSWRHYLHGVPEDYREIAALAEHPHVPRYMRILAPVVLLLNLVFFTTGDLSIGARVDVIIEIIGYQVELLGFAEFSLVSSVRDLWEAGAYPLALLIGTLSGAWPYAKTVLMAYCWFARPSHLGHKKRTTVLTYLDMFGKFALVEIYFLVLIMVAFRISILSPRFGVLPDETYSANIVVSPIWGLYAFCIASCLSLLLSNVMMVQNHHIQEKRREETEDRIIEEKLGKRMEEDDTREPDMEAVVLARHPFRLVATEEYRFTVTRFGQFTLFGLLVLATATVIIGGLIPAVTLETMGIVRNIIQLGEPAEDEDLPFAYPTSRLSLWGVASRLWVLNDFSSIDGTMGVIFLLCLYLASTVFLPLLQVVGVMYAWLRPWKLAGLRRFLLINEVISAWCGLEIFLISVLVGILELGQVSEYLLMEQCAEIIPLLEDVLIRLGIVQYEGDRVFCFRITPEVESGSFFLLVGIIIVNVLVQIVLHLAHIAVKDLEHSRLMFKIATAGGAPGTQAPGPVMEVPRHVVGSPDLKLALEGEAPEVEYRSGVLQKLMKGSFNLMHVLRLTRFAPNNAVGPWQHPAKRLDTDDYPSFVGGNSASPLTANPLYDNMSV